MIERITSGSLISFSSNLVDGFHLSRDVVIVQLDDIGHFYLSFSSRFLGFLSSVVFLLNKIST